MHNVTICLKVDILKKQEIGILRVTILRIPVCKVISGRFMQNDAFRKSVTDCGHLGILYGNFMYIDVSSKTFLGIVVLGT